MISIESGEKVLMEFYGGNAGGLKIRVWDQLGDKIVYLSQVDAKKVVDYIQAYCQATEENLIHLA